MSAEKNNQPEAPAGPAANNIRLERNTRGEVLAYVDGGDKPLEDVRVARCFPWSLQQEFISIRDKDGKEIALLEGLAGLDEQTRSLIDQELREKFFVPKIRRILRHSAEFGVTTITAQTDRGKVDFQFRDRDDVRMLSNRRLIFRDVDGNVYEIEDFGELDRASQKHVEHYF